MRYLLDTNIVSEMSKRTPNAGVLAWFEATEDTDLFLSVITLGEIRKGIEYKRRTDPSRARRLERTLQTIQTDYRGRIVPVSEEVADEWGRMCAVYPNHSVDNLLSATAKIYGMTLVTRNLRDVEIHAIAFLNPFGQCRLSEPGLLDARYPFPCVRTRDSDIPPEPPGFLPSLSPAGEFYSFSCIASHCIVCIMMPFSFPLPRLRSMMAPDWVMESRGSIHTLVERFLEAASAPVAYDYERKEAFHRHGMALLRRIAQDLGDGVGKQHQGEGAEAGKVSQVVTFVRGRGALFLFDLFERADSGEQGAGLGLVTAGEG